jgi:hypothetical protein
VTEAPQQDRRPTADIATTIGNALAQASETTGASSTEDAAEDRTITEAMVCLLVGVPLCSDGQLTIKALAEEAGLRRNKLTHKHTELKDLFYALVRSQDHRPRSPTDCTPTTINSARNSPTSAPNAPGSKTRSRPTPASSTSWKSKTPSYASKASPATSSVHCNDRPTEPRPSWAWSQSGSA